MDQYILLFRDAPGLINLITHEVDTDGATPIKQHPYWIYPQKWTQIKPEFLYMQEMGMFEHGSRDWNSPLIPVNKPDLNVCLSITRW